MKNIDLVFGYLIQSSNGVSSVVRLLYDNKAIFEKNGVRCNFFIRGNYTPDAAPSSGNQSSPTAISAKSKIKKSVKKLLDNATRLIPTLHSAYSIYNMLMLPGKRIAKRYVSQESPESKDPLFFHDIFSCYYYLKYTKAKNRPILMVIHSNGETYNMLKMSFPDVEGSWIMKKLNKIEDFTFSRVSDIGFVAKSAMDHFKNLHPELKDVRLHYVYNGLPKMPADETIAPKQSKDDRIELCCVGSLSYRKGQDIIIDALAGLSNAERDRIHVTFLGDGTIRRELEDDCGRKGLSECVSFEGNRTDVDRYLCLSDIFILTSRDEGFPMAILEAERAGLPVISTRIAGIPEMIVDGETGLIISPSKEELLPIFRNIDGYDWAAMGKRSKALFDEKFTIENTIGNYSSIFKSM